MSATETPTHLRENPFELARAQLAAWGRRSASTRTSIRVLGECKKTVEVSIPVAMDDGTVSVFRGVPGRPQHDARPRQGRDPVPPGGHARRDPGPRDVDDVEVRTDGAPLRRRQGRRRLRPEDPLDGGARAPHPPLHDRDHQRDRAREGHPCARCRHGLPGDGLDLRHLLDERRPLRARRRHRQAARRRGVGRPGRGDRPGRPQLHPDRAPEGGAPLPGHAGRDPGIRDRRPQPRRAPGRGGRPRRRAVGLEGRRREQVRHRRPRRRPAQVGARRARRPARHGGCDERGAHRVRVRRARAGCARAGDQRRERAPHPRAHDLRGGERPDDARGGRDPRGPWHLRAPRRARERRRGGRSYFEWVQGLQEYFWKEYEVNAKLNDIVVRAFEETWAARERFSTSMRTAAYGLAVQRVAEATTTRGLYP